MSKFSKKVKTEVVDVDNVIPWKVDPEVSIVIDMDEQVFITAAACEERLVQVTNSLTDANALFKNRTVFKDFLHGLSVDDSIFEIEDYQKPEKVSFAINTLKNRLNSICRLTECDPANMQLYIDGGDNFRTELPLAVEYKGNRKDTIRPVLLAELKAYAIDHLGSEPVVGMETDDMVCLLVSEGYKEGKKVIGVTQDKDSRQVEGLWFNYEKDKKVELIEGFGDLYLDTSLKVPDVKGKGWKFLYYQVLCADKADNYCSRDTYPRMLVDGKLDPKRKKPRFRPKTAFTALQKCKNHKQCLQLLVDQYKKWYGEDEFEYLDFQGTVRKATWLDILSMQFQLAYMKRSLDDKTCIRKILKKVKIIE